MSWLLKRREKEPVLSIEKKDDIILGVQLFFKREGDDLAVSGKVRTEKDLERLKKIFDEMVEELLSHEGQRDSTASTRGVGKRY